MSKSIILIAYRLCEKEKQYAERRRGTDVGIAVDEDIQARYWQRRDRQSIYFWTKIYKFLSNIDLEK